MPQYSPPSLSRRYQPLAIVAIGIFFIGGVLLLASSKAATPYLAVESEQGTLKTPAKVISDTTASSSSAIDFVAAATPPAPPTLPPASSASSITPCVGASAPTQWKHVVVLMYENKGYTDVIGSASSPWITSMADTCGTYTTWKDANYKASGARDGNYVSKPNYATLTSGLSPSGHGIKDDTYATTTAVDNIYNRLKAAGRDTKNYYSGKATPTPCAASNFSGAYHDAIRYYTDLGKDYCNSHDVPVATFMSDVNAGNLPAFSMILPTNDQNTHNNSLATGDAWAKSFLVPLLDSARYKSGDTAVFFLWDEDTPIPTVFLAPSIKPGTKPVPSGSLSFSHFSATRTWQEMLGITPLLGDTGQAPSMLNYYNGK